MERLWSADAPATAAKSIQKYVSNLRKLLGRNRVVSEGGYRLRAEESEIDAFELESALTIAARTTSVSERVSVLDEALGLWRGEPFADLTEPLFLEPVRRRLEEVRLAIEEERLGGLLELGHTDQVIASTEVLLAEHSLWERIWQIRMSALTAAGRQADALEGFRQVRAELVEQLGIDPSPESQALERGSSHRSQPSRRCRLRTGTCRPRGRA